MSEHNLYKLRLNPNAPINKVMNLVRESDSTLYAIHKALWSILPEEAKQNRNNNREDVCSPKGKLKNIPSEFLYRRDIDASGMPVIHLLTHYQLDTESHPLWQIDKASNTIEEFIRKIGITTNTELNFSLCVNPTKTMDKVDDRVYEKLNGKPLNPKKTSDKKTTRVDVLWSARGKEVERDRRPPEERSWFNQGVFYSSAQEWLSGVAKKKGFELVPNTLAIKNYQRILHPKHKGSVKSMQEFEKAEKLSLLDVTGYLKVTDTELFLNTLTKGIGHAKAWGCGLMLIKRG
jgi:CRISPR-associated protein Cas6/Cse3/CasE subtype I-E